jgi:hypothetical protein
MLIKPSGVVSCRNKYVLPNVQKSFQHHVTIASDCLETIQGNWIVSPGCALISLGPIRIFWFIFEPANLKKTIMRRKENHNRMFTMFDSINDYSQRWEYDICDDE